MLIWESARSLLGPFSDLNTAVKRRNQVRIVGSLLAVPVVAAVTLLTARSARTGTDLLRVGGVVLIAAGATLRLWALGSIGGHKKRRLVTWGPYRHLRHPLYGGSLLLVLGFAAAAGSITAAALAGLLFSALYVPVLRAEERFLADQFGHQWQAYCARTGRLLPRLGRVPSGPRARFRLLRPAREIAAVLLVSLLAFGIAVLADDARTTLGLPDWFR